MKQLWRITETILPLAIVAVGRGLLLCYHSLDF